MGSRGPVPGAQRKYNPAEVVRVALEAYRQGQSMAVAVGGHFGMRPA